MAHFVPGVLSIRDPSTGLALSTGLPVKIIAKAGERVKMMSSDASSEYSDIVFHDDPDGAAIFETPAGGWVYVSNSESLKGKKKGGAFALIFDKEGEIVDYQMRLVNTTRNCSGGKTFWNTWVSCEETDGGQCWQVDPLGNRTSEKTKLGDAKGGKFEAMVRSSLCD
jgi:secreted PhoX family phosphatase